MSRLAGLVVIGMVSAGLAACGGSDEPVAKPKAGVPAAAAAVAEGRLGRPTTVSSKANIFGAGRDEAPNPGGGGAGVLPPVWRLPGGTKRVVTVPAATGRITPAVNVFAKHGPAGSREDNSPTDITSHHGISGIVHGHNGMFLAGVFMTDDPPGKHPPPRLDFTNRERLRSLAPRIGQTFLIGDGKGRSYRVPSRATRLFLGFTDAYLFNGLPGWYGNNAGELTVTVKITSRQIE